MPGILQEIIANKKQEVDRRKELCSVDALMQSMECLKPTRDFKRALKRKGTLKRKGNCVTLLAEIKAASPSSGAIRHDIDAAEIAALYEECGANAISVLTDEKYFAGTDEHLQLAKLAVSLPVLRKDFTVDEYQIFESRALGADAILLMAQVLDPSTFESFYKLARQTGLYVLAEGHTREQIKMIVDIGADVIGINNRDFDTMQTSIETTLSLRELVPPDRALVSQSGIATRDDVLRLQDAGVDAIQVGTSIMQTKDMKAHIQFLLGQ